MRLFFILITLVMLSSCSFLTIPQEVVKTVWGSSTRALEKARDQAIVKTYPKPYWDCIHATAAVVKKEKWVIFKREENKGYMVLMGVKGSVDTTEIGVFFVEVSDNSTRIEISSLSTNARRKVAKALFHRLDAAFGLLPPDGSLP